MVSFALVARHNIVFESDTVLEVLKGDEDNTEYPLSCDIVDVESSDDTISLVYVEGVILT